MKPDLRTLLRTCLLCACLLPLHSNAAPLLRCYLSYGGETQILEVSVSEDPYQIAAVDIAGRFRFKAMMIGTATHIDYIKLYAYFQASDKDVLLQEASYHPPFPASAAEHSLTGNQFLYASNLERELQYHCVLQQQ